MTCILSFLDKLQDHAPTRTDPAGLNRLLNKSRWSAHRAQAPTKLARPFRRAPAERAALRRCVRCSTLNDAVHRFRAERLPCCENRFRRGRRDFFSSLFARRLMQCAWPVDVWARPTGVSSAVCSLVRPLLSMFSGCCRACGPPADQELVRSRHGHDTEHRSFGNPSRRSVDDERRVAGSADGQSGRAASGRVGGSGSAHALVGAADRAWCFRRERCQSRGLSGPAPA